MTRFGASKQLVADFNLRSVQEVVVEVDAGGRGQFGRGKSGGAQFGLMIGRKFQSLLGGGFTYFFMEVVPLHSLPKVC